MKIIYKFKASHFIIISVTVTLSFNSDSYIVLENEGSVEVCLILNAPLSIPALDVIVTTTATVTDTATAGMCTHVHYALLSAVPIIYT